MACSVTDPDPGSEESACGFPSLLLLVLLAISLHSQGGTQFLKGKEIRQTSSVLLVKLW